MKVGRKSLLAAVLSVALLLPVVPAFAQGNALGDLLTAVGQLVGSTEVNAQAKATIQTGDVSVTAVAATKETAEVSRSRNLSHGREHPGGSVRDVRPVFG